VAKELVGAVDEVDDHRLVRSSAMRRVQWERIDTADL